MEENIISIVNQVDSIALVTVFSTSSFLIFFGIDDLIIDLVFWIKRIKPKCVTMQDIEEWKSLPQKRIAIMIANWKESDVIESMVKGNLSEIDYDNYIIFLGVYPNDIETLEAAKRLENNHSRVVLVVNHKDGPTSKGQMLNQIVSSIVYSKNPFLKNIDIFMIHDSEDIIHPLSLLMINYEMEKYDFIQIPVFSFKLSWNEWIGLTYLDEFAESHTKDLLVREALGGGVPSAGVGTAISVRVISEIIKIQNGQFLLEDTLTEDYVLGLTVAQLGFKSHFVCQKVDKNIIVNSRVNGIRSSFIATHEYFPKKISNAIRQKTRWTLGIAFQGVGHILWKGSLGFKYFLFRDRKGPVSHLITFVSWVMVLYFICRNSVRYPIPNWMDSHLFITVCYLNIGLMLNRLFQRLICIGKVGSFSTVLTAPLRYPVASIINFIAGAKAFLRYRESVKTGLALKWAKTQHELPVHFGAVETNENQLKTKEIEVSI